MAVTHTTQEVAAEDVLRVGSRVSWGAILAGAVVSLAIYFLFTVLGTAIGLSVTDESSGREVGIGAAIYAVVVTLLSLFVGGYITSLCAVGENKLEATVYGVIMWGVVFFALLWLMVSGIKLGFNAVIGVASTAPAQQATQQLSQEEMQRGTPQTQEQIDRMKQQLPQEARELAPAAWWTFGGILLSMLAAIGGCLAGSGPRPVLGYTGFRTTTATVVPPASR